MPLKLGPVLVFAATILAGLLVVPAASQTNAATTISLMASSMAFVLMAFAQLLATRPPGSGVLFGGLDRLYHFHRQIGILIFVLILVHYFVTPVFRGLSLTGGLNTLAKDMGNYAFYALVGLLLLSLIKTIPRTKLEFPYHIWRWTHRLIGIVFIMVAIHQMFIKRPFESTALIANYLNVFALIGIASYLYTQVLSFLRWKSYRVTSVEKHAGGTLVTAQPKGRGIKAIPGQFAFLSAARWGLREPHPFTIAGIEGDGTVRFAIKPSGDFTRRLRDKLEVGDTLRLQGGHGRFYRQRGGPQQIWLAGGIGITPFLAMAADLKGDEPQSFHLVYCVRDSQEAIGLDALEAAAERLPNFKFSLHESSTQGRLDAVKLVSRVTLDPGDSELWYCGPAQLRQSIVAGLKTLGQKPKLIEFERFEFR